MDLRSDILAIVNQNSRTKDFDKSLFDNISENIIFHNSDSLDLFSEILDTYVSGGIRKIIVCGGDGSLHHLVNFLMINYSHLIDEFKIGLLPFGTGNDWVRNFSNIPTSHILDKIQNDVTRKVDIGEICFEKQSDRYFVNLCGVGFNTAVIQNIDKFKFVGNLSYYLALIYTLFGYKSQMIRGIINGKSIEKEIFIASFGIGKYAGGNMKICPDAVVDDGLFDIKIISNASKWKIIQNILRLQSGKHLSYLEHLSIKSEKIEFYNPIETLEADGELIKGKISKIEIIPKAMSFYV